VKHAYVSLVLTMGEAAKPEDVATLDKTLTRCTRLHEIVVAVPFGTPAVDYAGLDLAGPVTTVSTFARASADSGVVAGLSRSVGDFVIEWRGRPSALDADIIDSALAPTDEGRELVEIVGRETSAVSRFFYRTVNALRARSTPVRKTIGRVYSRHSLGQVLAATTVEPQLDILAAELPVARGEVQVDLANPHRPSMVDRVGEGANLLSKGTRFGSTVPLGLAIMSAIFGTGAALYAVGVFLVRGQTPEGWTTLMIVMGLGQAAVLVMLGLVWSRMNAMARGLSQRRDATAAVTVVAATDPDSHHIP
jgi:hypothetical protein